MSIDEQLMAVAKRIAERANECCSRSDGYEEDVRDFALEEMRRVIANSASEIVRLRAVVNQLITPRGSEPSA